MSKKITTITTTILATIGAIATAAVVLYKKGYLAIEVEKDEPEEDQIEESVEEIADEAVLETAEVEAIEPEVISPAPKKHRILKPKTTKD